MTRPARSVVRPKNTSHLLSLGPLCLPSPSVMGVLNVTPDSFSDGGRFLGIDAALAQAKTMVADGAAIIDIGGESTRPGAEAVPTSEELERVVPIIAALHETVDVPISIDTSKPEVMCAAIAAGAAMINDVLALQAPGALEAASELAVPVCLMHMQGRPRSMQANPQYGNVVADVVAFLNARVAASERAGIDRNLIVIDPGFGFGKAHRHNVELLANLQHLRALELPILVGLSRKATWGELTGRAVHERMPASIAAATIAVTKGVQLIRAHDVRETVDALRIASAVLEDGL